MEVDKRIKGLTKNIIGICLEITATGNDAFFSFQAHAGWLDVKVYSGSWDRNKDPIYSKDYIDLVISHEEVESLVINKLKKTAKELTVILEGFLEKS